MNLLFLNLVWEEANRIEKLGKQYDCTFPTLQVTLKLNGFLILDAQSHPSLVP